MKLQLTLLARPNPPPSPLFYLHMLDSSALSLSPHILAGLSSAPAALATPPWKETRSPLRLPQKEEGLASEVSLSKGHFSLSKPFWLVK